LEKDKNYINKIKFPSKDIEKLIKNYIDKEESLRNYSDKIIILEENNSPKLNSYLNLIDKELKYYKEHCSDSDPKTIRSIVGEMFKDEYLVLINYKNKFLLMFKYLNPGLRLEEESGGYFSLEETDKISDVFSYELILSLTEFPLTIVPIIKYKDGYQSNRLKRIMMELSMNPPKNFKYKKIGEI
jgi:hypothetical protein